MPIITISRGTMSGGRALAELVARALGCACIAREVLIEAAAKLGVSEESLQERMERSPGLFGRLTTERRMYAIACQAALAERAVQGDLVYHGLAGHLLLNDVPEVLRVRLIAPVEMRVRALMEERSMSRDDARRYIEKVDAQRAKWTRLMYDADIEDLRLYDVVLNLEKTTVESACEAVLALARRPEYSLDAAARVRLRDFALASRVQLSLETHPASRGLGLETSVRGGVVTLTGSLPQVEFLPAANELLLAELRGFVERVPGVEKVVLDVRPFAGDQ